MNAALETRGLSYAYGRHLALDGLDLDLPAGEILGLIGPNGAGKTTALRILTGQLHPRSGAARVLGDDCLEPSPTTRAKIGMVFEGVRLPAWMRVRELLRFCQRLHPTWDESLAASILREFRIDEKRRIRSLSRGEHAQLALLSSLAYRPQILLLDEPFGGLDALARVEILERLLAQVHDTGCSVLLASHDLADVERVADRIAFLHGGRLRYCETPEELVARHSHVRLVFEDESNATADHSSLGIGVRREGRVVEYVDPAAKIESVPPAGARVERRPLSLEEIFIAWGRHLRDEEAP